MKKLAPFGKKEDMQGTIHNMGLGVNAIKITW